MIKKIIANVVGSQVIQGRCLRTKRYFCAVYDYTGKADLSKGTTHFSSIIIQKSITYKTTYSLFSQVEANYR